MHAKNVHAGGFLLEKKRNFILLPRFVSFSLFFFNAIRGTCWKLKSVFFGVNDCTRIWYYFYTMHLYAWTIHYMVRYSIDRSEKLAFNVFNFLIIAMEKRCTERSINRDPLFEKFIRDAFFHEWRGWLRNKVLFSPSWKRIIPYKLLMKRVNDCAFSSWKMKLMVSHESMVAKIEKSF